MIEMFSIHWNVGHTDYWRQVQCADIEPLTCTTSERFFSTACGRHHADRQEKSRITRRCLKTLDCKRKLAQISNVHKSVWSTEYSTVPHWTCSLEEIDVICCNCDFIYRPTIFQLRQKSGSSRILGVEYLNPVSGRNSVSIRIEMV